MSRDRAPLVSHVQHTRRKHCSRYKKPRELQPRSNKAGRRQRGASQVDMNRMENAIQQLEVTELQIAERLGMSGGTVDSVTVFLATRRRAVDNADHWQDLVSLNKLRILRQKRSRAQKFGPWKVTTPPIQLGLPHRCDGSRFWVVLIGIDKYNGRPLHGCVSDAQLMKKYFIEELRVPPERIQLLLGSEDHASPDDPMYPSRKHITDMLHSLATNDKIKYGDNIVIYYAGHGSYYTSYYGDDGDQDEGEDENQEFIEAFCPIDRDTFDVNGKRVPDISDREVNVNLNFISRAKGDRITLILDCCHSASIDRSIYEPGARTNDVTQATLEEMLLAGEESLKGYADYPHGFIRAKNWDPDMGSHVLLAACKEWEFAKEKTLKGKDGAVVGYVGFFTESLVHFLQSGSCKAETTYEDLIDGLRRSIHQTPVVAGKNMSVRLWFQNPQAKD